MAHETLPTDIAAAIDEYGRARSHAVIAFPTLKGAALMDAALERRAALEATILRHLRGEAEEERVPSAIAGGAA